MKHTINCFLLCLLAGCATDSARTQIAAPGPASVASPVAATDFEAPTPEVRTDQGLLVSFFRFNDPLNQLPDIDPDATPILTKVVPTVDFVMKEGVPFKFAGTNLTSNFAARFTGTLKVPIDGIYSFFSESDDGSRLFIDNLLVVANDGWDDMAGKGGKIHLTTGDHALRLDYYQTGGALGCRLFWGYQNVWEIIPASAMVPMPTYEDALRMNKSENASAP